MRARLVPWTCAQSTHKPIFERMSRTGPRPLYLMVLIQAILCSSGVCAQTAQNLQGCPSRPAENAAGLRNGPQNPAQPKSTKIDVVNFDGPVSLPDDDLARLTDELEDRKFDAASDWTTDVADTIVGRLWGDEGYLRARVTLVPEMLSRDSDGQHVALRIHVDEGHQFFLGDVKFRTADPAVALIFHGEQLRSLIPLKHGDLFAAEIIRESLDAMRHLYGSHGYVDASMEPQLDVDDEHRRVNLTIQIDQQKQYRIRKIEVLGLDPATEAILRAMMRSGDVFDVDTLNRFLEENRSGLPIDASMRDVDLRRDVKNGTVDVAFNFSTCSRLQD
jgi:Surface antigen variable number repeat